jgi:hypothetical protein
MDLGDYVRLQMQHDPHFAPQGRSGSSSGASPGAQTAYIPEHRNPQGGNANVDSEPLIDNEPSFDDESPNHLLTGNEKFYSPDGENSFDDPGASGDHASEEDWERALTEESLVPDFDVVAPPSSSQGKKRWFQFWKKQER